MVARRVRLDRELVRRGLATSRTQAADLIASGLVTVGGAPADKAARLVATDQPIAVDPSGRRWASRGGDKLAGALDTFELSIAGRHCLDAGASTGGFTDVLLARGAATVAAVDVGYGQLDWRLRSDERVSVLDRTNARHLRRGHLPGEPPDLVVADLSFISLRLVLPALRDVASPEADYVLLVKPQFEAGPQQVGSGGVVRDPSVWRNAIAGVLARGAQLGLAAVAITRSVLPGPSGNVEFFVWLQTGVSPNAGPAQELAGRAVEVDPGVAVRPRRLASANVNAAKVVGLIVHPGRANAQTAARAAATALDQTNIRVVGCAGDRWASGFVEVRSPEDFSEAMDAVLVFGGDGTFLRAAYLARDRGVPLLGVNLGRLGFLAELEEGNVSEGLRRLADGDFSVEERMTLAVDVHDSGGAVVSSSWALNEASVERVIPQRVIVLQVAVGDVTLTEVPADAMICATPTGSTAYAFSARGPILSPLMDAILLVPVAPHSLFDRTLVIAPSEALSVRPIGSGNTCVVSLDGRESLRVPDEGWVAVRRDETPVRLIRLGGFDFYERVRDKFVRR